MYIIASEGLRDKDGHFVSEFECVSQDNFGHAQLGGVSGYLRNLILDSGITTRVKALELGILQRCAMHCVSEIDLEEAFQAGYEALRYASEGNSGYMVAIRRINNSPYTSEYFLIEADKVANNVKYFPSSWINEEGNNLTEEALKYLSPLVSSIPKKLLETPLPNFTVFNK